MKHLSGMDAAFLYLETPEMPLHVGSLNIYDCLQATTAISTKTSRNTL